jgi:hypothetical protein
MDSENSLTGITVGAADAPARSAGSSAALPCQYNDKCIGEQERWKWSPSQLTPNRKLMWFKMVLGIEWMVRKYGLERVGLLTLSFGVPGSGKGSSETFELRQQAKQWKFVQGRWHSFRTNVVADRYSDWICVFEQHRDRVWHLHVVVVTKEDIRTGTNIEVLSDYKLPYQERRGKHLRNEALALEWKTLRQVCRKYRFGRVELLPVRKTAQAVGRYLGGYLVKTYEALPAGERHRLIRFSSGINGAISNKFSIWSLGNLIYRTRLKIVADMVGFQDYGDFADYFGPRWHFRLKNIIRWVPMPFRFLKGDFESGLALRTLRAYAQAPKLCLDEREQAKIGDVSREMWRRLEETFDENSDALLQLRSLCPGDNTGDGPATPDGLQSDLFDDPLIPF